MADNLLLPFTLDRAVDSAGLAYAAAVYVYDAGTTNEKDVKTNFTLATAADNPVRSNSGGWYPARYIGTGSYKLVFYDTNGSENEGDWTLLKTEDNLPGALDTSSFLTGSVTTETPVITKTSNYPVVDGDQSKIINGDPTGGTFTLTLPSAVTVGDGWRVGVHHVGTANDINIAPSVGQSINGVAANYVLTFRDASVTLIADGANWWTEGFSIGTLPHGKFVGRTTTGDKAPEVVVIPFGQCRLAKDGTSLRLSPHNGNLITINSAAEVIQDAGVTLAVGGLSNSTLYYVYAYMDSGTMTMEGSATVPVAQAGTGVQIKTGDATRTLVGMAYLIGGAFVDSAAQRFVRSYFNDPGIATLNAFTANRTTTSTSYAEINSEIRNEFLIWSGETFLAGSNGAVQNSGAADSTATSIGFDGTTAEDTYARVAVINNNVDRAYALSFNKTGLSEGYHYATLLGLASANTGLWTGGATLGNRSTLRGFAKR